jgi:polysaccharide export outer membrane protein
MSIRTLLANAMIGLCMAVLAPLAANSAPPAPVGGQPAAPASVAPSPQAVDENYILGPGDTLEVDMLERTDFNTKAKIGSDGMIQLPYIGSIAASDRTPQQLSDQIRAALIKGGFFSRPILSVDVIAYASRYVTVLGAVTTPGLVPIDRAYHVSEILARVGGVREGAADYVIIRPAKGVERHLPIKALATGDLSEDPYVSPGDTIFSPTAEVFYISGQVKAPGAYAIITGMTVRMAVGRGGGLTDLGSEHAIKITRGGVRVGRVELDSKVEPGDVIVVGERLF